MPASWALGIMCSLGSCFLSSMGLIIQKLSHNKGEMKLAFYKRKWWFLGFFLLVVAGGAFDAMALVYAPISLLAPVAGVTILLNALLAPLVLKENITKIEVISSIVIMCGTSLTTVFGDHTEAEYDLAGGFALLEVPLAYGYCIVSVFFIFCSFFVVQKYKPGAPEQIGRPFYKSKAFVGFIHGCFASQLGVIGNIMLKLCAQCVSVSSKGENQFVIPGMYALIVLTILFCTLQLVYLNVGLARFNAIFILIIYQSTLIAQGVVAGACYFNEFATFGLERWILFLGGMLLNVLGLAILSKSKLIQQIQAPEEEDTKCHQPQTNREAQVLPSSPNTRTRHALKDNMEPFGGQVANDAEEIQLVLPSSEPQLS